MNFDTSKFKYTSVTAGTYNPGTNTYVYLNYEDVADLSSVRFSFKAKATGTGSFNISGAVLSSNTATIGASKANVTVEKASSGNKGTTSKPKPSTTKNPSDQTNEEPQQITKSELDAIKLELEDKIETDYTEESWKALQEAIAKAEAAATNEEYDAVKNSLNIESLVIADFEKDELFNLLIELIGKSQKDYTEESWQELQDAIGAAQKAELKSEYDGIKDKLTINTLVEKARLGDIFANFIQGLEKGDPIYLAVAGMFLLLILIILILLIVLCKGRKARRREVGARRLK